jgi:hypothetical protein
MRQLLLLFPVLILLFSCNHKQSYDPLSLSQRIFSREAFPEIEKYSAGEYKGHPNGQDLAQSINTSFRLLQQTDSLAVVNVTITDSAGGASDAYLYLKKDSVWKVTAFRALAMTGMAEMVLKQLETMAQAQIDSVIASPGTDKPFKSQRDYKNMEGNMKLTLASDNELIAHFTKNKQAFESLKNELLAKGIMETSGLKEMNNADNLDEKVKGLFLSNVDTDGEGTNKYLNFLIGGVIDNSVGYLYIKNKKNVPQMSPSNFIMVREIGDGWYLYKTT